MYTIYFFLIKDAFHERVKCYQHWQHSQMMLKKKRELKERLEIAGRQDKLETACQEVVEVRILLILIFDLTDPYYYVSIRLLSLRRTFLGCFFDIGSAISRCGTTIEPHYSRRK